jgi:hypothetical protein
VAREARVGGVAQPPECLGRAPQLGVGVGEPGGDVVIHVPPRRGLVREVAGPLSLAPGGEEGGEPGAGPLRRRGGRRPRQLLHHALAARPVAAVVVRESEVVVRQRPSAAALHLLQERARIAVAASQQERDGPGAHGISRRLRVELEGRLRPLDRPLEQADVVERACDVGVRRGQPGVDLERAAALGDDANPLELGLAVDVRQRHVRLGEIGVERPSPFRLPQGARAPRCDLRAPGETQVHLRARHGKAGVRQGVARVQPQRLLEGGDRSLRAVLASVDHRRPAAEVSLVRAGVLGTKSPRNTR